MIAIDFRSQEPVLKIVKTFRNLLVAFVFAVPSLCHSASAVAEDELTDMGLPVDVGRDEVEAYCGACHSLKLVVQQGLSRAAWEETLQWMVDEQEMEPLESGDHKLVLDYLSKHVSIEAHRKRQKE